MFRAPQMYVVISTIMWIYQKRDDSFARAQQKFLRINLIFAFLIITARRVNCFFSTKYIIMFSNYIR